MRSQFFVLSIGILIFSYQSTPALGLDSQEIPATCSAAQSGGEGDGWIVGTWKNKVSTIRFSREGNTLKWNIDRMRHETKKYGTKAAMSASGVVEQLTPCAVVMVGHYVTSESSYIVGKPVTYRLVLDARKILSGTFRGAQNMWVPMRYFRKLQ